MIYLNKALIYNCLILLINYGIALDRSVENHKNFKLLSADCGISYSDRIIGGHEVLLGQYPWLARLGFEWSECNKNILYRCGGTLINNRYVLSAAHCVTELPTIVCPSTKKKTTLRLARILLGEHNSKTDPDCDDEVCAPPVQKFIPQQVIVHPNYSNPMYAHDICLIRLDEKVIMNGWVAPACLPRGKMLIKYHHKGERAEIAGWGYTNASKGVASTVLMAVRKPILEIKACKFSGHRLNLDASRQICAGGEENKDSCGGDSGGPLMIIESDNGSPRYYAIGILSFGVTECGKKDSPAIYTRIRYYMKWIVGHLRR